MNAQITHKQYTAARKMIVKCQKDSTAASRAGDQTALDAASQEAAKALAIIAEYKDQQSNK